MITFPSNCNTPEERTGFCYRAQELLRLIHNGMGRWFREGLTENQWDRFPQRIKNRYPYKPKLSQAEWDDFYRLFEIIQDRVIQPLLKNRELLKSSGKWPVDPEDLTSED